MPARRSSGQGKRYTASARTERQGIALCSTVVSAMGHIWHERDVDHGIDGEIELVDNGRATNRVLWVQSKARGTSNPFTNETERGFRFLCTPDDIDYWTTGTAPVLLVCSHPESGDAWFKHLGTWFAEPARRRNRYVDFDKDKDRFHAAVGRDLLELGVDATSELYLSPIPRTERLMTNLLTVSHLAEGITAVETTYRGRKDAHLRLRQLGLPPVADLAFTDGRLYTLRAPSDPIVMALQSGSSEQIDIASLSTNEVTRRIVAWVLNGTLQDLRHRELRTHRDTKVLYFVPTRNGGERRAKSRGGTRKVVSHHRPKDDQTWMPYTRHFAVDARFEFIDNSWLLALNPTYHFTSDGYEDFAFADAQLSGLKRLEGHEAVRNLVRFWADYLTWHEDLFDPDPDPRLQLGDLLAATVNRGIDDARWKPRSKAIQVAAQGELQFDDEPRELAQLEES